jgi:hypothetical protein
VLASERPGTPQTTGLQLSFSNAIGFAKAILTETLAIYSVGTVGECQSFNISTSSVTPAIPLTRTLSPSEIFLLDLARHNSPRTKTTPSSPIAVWALPVTPTIPVDEGDLFARRALFDSRTIKLSLSITFIAVSLCPTIFGLSLTNEFLSLWITTN